MAILIWKAAIAGGALAGLGAGGFVAADRIDRPVPSPDEVKLSDTNRSVPRNSAPVLVPSQESTSTTEESTTTSSSTTSTTGEENSTTDAATKSTASTTAAPPPS